MRLVPGVILMVLLAGCGAPLADYPDPTRVEEVRRETFSVTSFDNSTISAIGYLPISAEPARWPVVVFLHGLGQRKEVFEGTEATENVLQRFATAGMVAVAYDARGHGESEGTSTLAGPAEEADLEAVLAHIAASYDVTDKVGVAGFSYGGGQALQAFARNARVTTAVGMFGWVDLYDSTFTNHVPKLVWAEALFALGVGGTGGRLNPSLGDWYQQALLRTDLATVEAEMDARSTVEELPNVDKPLFVCQGLQETLFPQIDQIWEAHPDTRAYIYTGGHTLMDQGCLDRTLAWFQHFLAGIENGVQSGPRLETADAMHSRSVSYKNVPPTDAVRWYLRDPDLAGAPNERVSFTISQRGIQNPFADPAFIGDVGPSQSIPAQLRGDPAAITFSSPAFQEGAILVGAPTLHLDLLEDNVGWQVAGQLLVERDGRSQIISRAAFAAINETHASSIDLRFHYTKADLEAGDRLVLKLAANDPSWWYPLLQNYEVSFTGTSWLDAPFY